MTIFIRFNQQGKQIEAIQRSTRPNSDWKIAPADFSWNKRYKLVQDQVLEMTEENLEEENLKTQKGLVLCHVQQRFHEILDQKTHIPLLDIQLKMAEAQVARVFLENREDTKAQEALQPLAKVWNLSLEETATKLQQEAEKTSQFLLLARTYQEKATLDIENITSLEDLESYSEALITQFEAEITTLLSGGSE